MLDRLIERQAFGGRVDDSQWTEALYKGLEEVSINLGTADFNFAAEGLNFRDTFSVNRLHGVALTQAPFGIDRLLKAKDDDSNSPPHIGLIVDTTPATKDRLLAENPVHNDHGLLTLKDSRRVDPSRQTIEVPIHLDHLVPVVQYVMNQIYKD